MVWKATGSAQVKPVLENLLANIRNRLSLSDKCIPYGCKATKCWLKNGDGVDVKVSCAIGNSSAMLSRYLNRQFEDYLKELHQSLNWDYELAENALNDKFVTTKIKDGYLWSKVSKPISRVDYYEVYELVKAIIPTIFTEKEKQMIKSYNIRYATKYGCSVQAHRKEFRLDVACLLYADHHPKVEEGSPQ
ncbi:unnamed protein product [Nippostrongylus brasiliensis]|uniref:DNA-directed DNA polymerase n=1 Tax=Nippostrongylus brasiliensis TaxID=27835 RepID=A0A0N4YBS3_NIPBR|nr:unnamed protein product [Nippostrongylus brasiliensis]